MSKILLIDDDPVLLKLYSTRLISDNHEVKTASNGEMALKLLPEFTPDLIIIDLLMPKLNGFAFLEQVKTSPSLANTKKIVFSSVVNEQQIARLKELNVDKYLNKTDTTPSELLTNINELIH